MWKRIALTSMMISMVSIGFAQTIIHQDDFSAGTLTGYSTLSDTTSANPPTTEAHSGFDFTALGLSIPDAPNGADNVALHTRVNISNSAREAINVFWDTDITAAYFEVQVDIWLHFAPSGTTEHAGIGIFASGTKANWSTIYQAEQNTDTDGLLFAFNSDNDELRSALFLTKGDAAGPQDVGTWANPEKTTPLGQFAPAPYYEPISGTDGFWGKRWITVRILVENDNISVYANDLLIVTHSDAALAAGADKKLFLFHADPFASLGNPDTESFCLFDNLVVTELPEPPPPLSADDIWALYP